MIGDSLRHWKDVQCRHISLIENETSSMLFPTPGFTKIKSYNLSFSRVRVFKFFHCSFSGKVDTVLCCAMFYGLQFVNLCLQKSKQIFMRICKPLCQLPKGVMHVSMKDYPTEGYACSASFMEHCSTSVGCHLKVYQTLQD